MKLETAKKSVTAAAEKAARAIRWLLLHPCTLAALVVFVAVLIGLALTCPSPAPSPDPGETARGAAAGALPVEQSVPDASKVLAENKLLRARVAALEAAVGATRTVGVINARTRPFPVKAPPRPPSPPPKIDPSSSSTAQPREDGGDGRRVALLEGEGVYLRLQGVPKRSVKSGRLYLPATIGAYRAADDSELGLEVLDIPLSDAVEAPPEPPRRDSWIWGGGPALAHRSVGAALLAVTPGRKVPLLPLRVRAWAVPAWAGDFTLVGGIAFEHD